MGVVFCFLLPFVFIVFLPYDGTCEIRLGGFSTEKKEGTSQAGKLVQTVLKLLTEEFSEALWVSISLFLVGMFFQSIAVIRKTGLSIYDAQIRYKYERDKCGLLNITRSDIFAKRPESFCDTDLCRQRVAIPLSLHSLILWTRKRGKMHFLGPLRVSFIWTIKRGEFPF